MKEFAIVFPGQGSQSVGMLAELAQQHALVQETFAEASAVIGVDLWQLAQQGPAEKLNQTEFTQPALLAAGVAVWRVWQTKTPPLPAVMAGHSLGEYTALVCAGALQFSDAVMLVHKRGQYMQTAVPEGQGAMAAILGLDDNIVTEVCAQAAQGGVLTAANFNSPGQIVIAGDKAAVERGIEQAKTAGAKRALLLPVSVPSHCALMRPAAERLAKVLDAIQIDAPKIPVLNNVDVSYYHSAEQIRDGLLRQLYHSVRWVELVTALAARPVAAVIEAGPGRVLLGLNKRIATDINNLAVYDDKTLDEAIGVIA
ncbi:MAG: ACP S-malonyltransferase [Gammaproteobacteria bacterium]|nr:ACP S-malonyltransferase [Gammaproteobacteria bacterium]